MKYDLEISSERQASSGASGKLRVFAIVAAILAAGWLAEAAWAGMGAGAAMGGAPPLAQFDPSRSTGPSAAGGGQWKLPAKIVAVVALTVAATMIACFVIFPRLLRRRKDPVWPLSAYGYCIALVCLVLTASVLGFFWYDLVITDKFGGTSFWREHGARLGVFVAGIFLAWLSTAIWHSDGREKPEPAEAKKG